MKNLITLIVIFISFQYLNAQGFNKTDKYKVVTEIKENGTDFPTYVVNLVRSGGISEKLSTFIIDDTELFEDIFITTLENPGLDGVSEVIKMEVEYLACCAEVDSYYYMVTNDNQLILLPELTNIYCANTNTSTQYTFPNQEYGVKGNILETEKLYKKGSTIKYMSLKNSLTWNDNTYKKQKSNTAITTRYK